jgi:uncharacterized circularly permuted ATP-grasp superfamily protein/uncharacterized alpha-E superfamily protein
MNPTTAASTAGAGPRLPAGLPAPPVDRFDEVLTTDGRPRPHWAGFWRDLSSRGPAEIAGTLAQVERQVRDSGVTYNVYADPQGADRPWDVDPIPLVLPAAEWETIEAAIEQRADLLNRVLADLYGPQELLRSGALPPAVVFGHSGFLLPLQGLRPPGGIHLFSYAADLARSADGHWWVVADRTQAPSGAGYAIENRLVVSRVFPQTFRDLHVRRLADWFASMRDSLMHWAPRSDRGERVPLIALLTPGPYNETYSEHALLARYLGFTLVEGHDLTVRDGCVWLKTVGGLQRVHAIVRRQDDEYCDPLELRSDSALGVAGLTDCARRGSVLIANALGSGVLESGALLGYLPALSERLLGEPLRMPSVATWWLGEPAAFHDAWRHLDRLLLKPLDRSPQAGIRAPAIFGADLGPSQREALRQRIAREPHRWVAQEWVHVSQAPVIERRPQPALRSRTVGLRVFAVATPQGWRVMPGGLTRVAGDGDARVIAMQRGGRSKDTWVLAEGPSSSLTLLSSRVRPDDLVGEAAYLSSRAAEHLYWFGRHSERCDHAARVLREAVSRLLASPVDGPTPDVALRHLVQGSGLVEADDDLAAGLLHASTHPAGRLAGEFRQLARVAFTLRDRMSADHWRSLNALATDPAFADAGSIAAARAWLDRAVTAMTTLAGFMLDGMTRNTGWRFLSIGRRIERLANLAYVLETAIAEGRDGGLDWLLELTDSGVTYRSRYLVAPEWLPVLDLLVRDPQNPRSLAFQLKGLVDFVERLETQHGAFGLDVLAPARQALARLGPADLDPDSETLAATLRAARRCAHTLSDELTLRFFTHAVSRSVLSLVARA